MNRRRATSLKSYRYAIIIYVDYIQLLKIVIDILYIFLNVMFLYRRQNSEPNNTNGSNRRAHSRSRRDALQLRNPPCLIWIDSASNRERRVESYQRNHANVFIAPLVWHIAGGEREPSGAIRPLEFVIQLAVASINQLTVGSLAANVWQWSDNEVDPGGPGGSELSTPNRRTFFRLSGWNADPLCIWFLHQQQCNGVTNSM